MDKLQKHYSNAEQTYPQWHDNEVLINADTTISSTMFGDNNKIYVIDTVINPTSETTFLVGNNSILKFTRNGQFGDNCIIDCATPLEIEAGMHKVFGAGTIKAILKNPIVYPEWWGAVGDGLTDDVDAINRCIQAAHRNTVFLGQSFYRITSGPILIREKLADVTRYEPLGLSSTTGSSETYWIYTNKEGVTLQGIEEKRRKIIINGCLIGDESLVGPVIFISGFTHSVLEVNGAIYVRNTSSSSCGLIAVGTITSSKIFINHVVKESNDRTGGGTTDHTGSGCGVIFGQQLWSNYIDILLVSGFEYGVVFTDRQTLPTLCPNFSTLQEDITGKASQMMNKIDIRRMTGVKHGVYFKYTVSDSFFNSNNIHVGNLIKESTIPYTEWGDGFHVEPGSGGFGENKITLDATDGCYKHVFNIQHMRSGVITTHANVQDVWVETVEKDITSTSSHRAINHLADSMCKVFKFTDCHDIQINTINNLFGETLDFTNCSRIKINNVYFTELLNISNTNGQIRHGITHVDKVKFDAELSIIDDSAIDATTSVGTSALILVPERRYLHNIHYVETLPTAQTTTNYQFYALTSTEYGTNIKLYALYDSLGRQVGYVYKDRYVTVEQ